MDKYSYSDVAIFIPNSLETKYKLTKSRNIHHSFPPLKNLPNLVTNRANSIDFPYRCAFISPSLVERLFGVDYRVDRGTACLSRGYNSIHGEESKEICI